MVTGRRPGARGARPADTRRGLHPVRPPGTPSAATGPAGDATSAPTGDGAAAGAPPPAGERSRAHAETFVAEDEVLTEARARGDARGVLPVGPGAAAALTFLAAATGARAVVEIGTGLGVGTVSLLRGMPGDGLLTSIDTEAEHQRLARTACTGAGFGPGRLRMITGRALDVMPRLSDGAYDLVLVDALTTEYPRYLVEAVRMLRPGGVVVLARAMGNGVAADPVRRDAVSTALRETARAVRDDERLVPLLVPLSDGLLCAARR